MLWIAYFGNDALELRGRDRRGVQTGGRVCSRSLLAGRTVDACRLRTEWAITSCSFIVFTRSFWGVTIRLLGASRCSSRS